MIFRKILSLVLLLVLASGVTVIAQETEEEIVNRYLQKVETKHLKRLGWVSASFSANRINRDNQYNIFAAYESNWLDGPEFSQLDMAWTFGAEAGILFLDRFSWSLGGEYWMEMGDQYSGSYTYIDPSGGPDRTAVDPQSLITVYGGYTGAGYYLLNPPSKSGHLTDLAVKVGGTVGYYVAKWNLWSEYQNLNLATGLPTGVNTTYQGTAPGFTLDLGAEYPVGLWGLVAVADLSYLYLNFTNVAWYNSQDEEIVISVGSTADSRVDLNLSGFRGKFELKRFFSW